MEQPDAIMTIEEAADYVRLHPLTMRTLARNREIPAFKVGRQWRIKRKLLDEWMEARSMNNLQPTIDKPDNKAP